MTNNQRHFQFNPRMRTGFAQRSFTYSAPHIWNTLPRDITGNLIVTANFQEETEIILLHYVIYIVSRDPPRLRFRHLTDRHTAR